MADVKHYAGAATGAYLYATDGTPPANSVVVPAPLNANYIWNGTVWLTPAPTSVQVNAERDRRAVLGFTYNGVAYQSDQSSRDAIDRNAMLAFVAITNGAASGNLRWSDPNADFYWIAADNSHITMDAQAVVALAQASAAFSTNLTLKASTLKAMNPIPTDYTADSYWS
jgi:hypothetical protein